MPCAGGGPYWPNPQENNSRDWRDYRKGEDSNQIKKDDIIVSIMEKMKEKGTREDLLEKGTQLLKDTALINLTEFGRATHAEMSAILSCARNGISPKGSTLYCTTFPCHNCAKHIIEVGIEKVLFVEPYPKSQAYDLHNDSILLPSPIQTSSKNKYVTFNHFIGVAARRYLDLFSLKLGMGIELKRKKKDGRVTSFNRGKETKVRVPLTISSYEDKENTLLSITL